MNIKTNLSRITIDIPIDLQKKLKSIAALKGRSMRDVVIESIEKELKKLERVQNNISAAQN